MPTIASIEDLKAAKVDIDKIKKEHPGASDCFEDLLNDHKKIGYKNIAKMFCGASPEELKS